MLFTSESVSAGHPDKVADYISDSILDAYLECDAYSRVAVECMITKGRVFIAGEVTSTGSPDVRAVVKNAIRELGYYDDYKYTIALNTQSPDIAMGVNRAGAGDQGMMFGYACDDTVEKMPAPVMFAHRMLKRLEYEREQGKLFFDFEPDAKSQVTVEYDDDMRVVGITDVVVSQQHSSSISIEDVRESIEWLIWDELGLYMRPDTRIFINPTGRFVIGGPEGDTGLTGRKIIVDTYGGMGRHGGGAFSGKDPTKVDRSGAYMARHIAVSLVGNFLCKRCEVQISYAIGVEEPVSVNVETFGTGILDKEQFEALVRNNFDLRPQSMIDYLDLRRPIYRHVTNYGHFGKMDMPWEQVKGLDYNEALKR